MSYQPPMNSHPPPVTPNYPAESMNRYLPPTANNPMTNGLSPVPNPAAVKQQFLPPTNQGQPKPPMVQQVYTNGLAPNSSNHSSRTASPALTQQQPINSNNLPPTSHQQTTRPNVYGANNSLPPTSQPMPTNFKPSTMNNAPTPPMPVTHQQSHANVDRLTNNLQNIHLNNGHVGQPPNGYSPSMQQPNVPVNKVLNGNTLAAAPPQQVRPNLPPPPPVSAVNTTQPPTHSIAQPPSISNIQHQQSPQQSNPFTPGNTQMNRPPLPGAQQTFQNFATSPVARPPATSQPPVNQINYNQVNNGIGQQAPPQMTNPNSLPQNSPAGGPTAGKRPMYPSTNQQTLGPQQQQPQFNQQAAQPYNNGTGQYYPQMAQAPQMQQQQQQQQYQQYQQPSVVNQGFNSLWGQNTVDLMQQRHILPTLPVEPARISLDHEFYESVNCSSDIIRSTLTKVPESNSLLQKSRLPFGILIHPFRDLNNLPVIQCSTIVRCRACRTYINPFVYFVDTKKWKCNLCYRINELPDEFQYDPVSKSYGDVTRRPEVKSSTIEFIAPSEYMLRPPQPAIYLFLLDVSMIAQQSGYLKTVCDSLIEHLEGMPGDARTQIGFIAYDSAVHFYSIAESFSQPHEITVVDIEDTFLPRPDNLLINLKECKELIKDLLTMLPTRFAQTHESSSALGAALQVAFKLMQQTGGRVTVFQTCLPNAGPGALQSRENPNERSAKDVQHLGPATDFFKRQALECSGQQIAVDLFLLNSQYSDLATISGISKYSGGCIHHFPLFNASKIQQVDAFKRCFERYLTRKIGFEAVMRVRCTRGLSIHTFHGNFFVRSTDLLSLPNVNPDAGFGMQISYEENLGESKTICFQAALLYTSSKGERRIRVHTLCLPVSNSLSDIIYSADAQAIIGLISKMAVDRSLQSSLTDARDAFINASCDIFSAFRTAQNIKQMSGQLLAPMNLSLLPLYMLALLKHTAFRTGTSTRLDDRVFAMCELKSLPLDQLIRYIYPDLYHLDCLFGENNNQNEERPEPPILQLSAEFLKARSMFLLDCGTLILILVGSNVDPQILHNVFGVSSVNEIPDLCYELPSTGTSDSENLHAFLESINVEKPYAPTIQIIRDNSPYRTMFTERLVDDRSESSLSYYEFLQHLRSQIK